MGGDNSIVLYDIYKDMKIDYRDFQRDYSQKLKKFSSLNEVIQGKTEFTVSYKNVKAKELRKLEKDLISLLAETLMVSEDNVSIQIKQKGAYSVVTYKVLGHYDDLVVSPEFQSDFQKNIQNYADLAELVYGTGRTTYTLIYENLP